MNRDPPLRVALWAAVSSAPQAAPDKTSIQDQLTAGRQFAADLSATIVATYTVPGHSRDIIFWQTAEQSMPAYRQLRHDATAHRFDILWALDIDRLGRDPALSNQVISLVESNGAEVYLASAPHPIGHKTTGHRYISAIQSVRAKEDQTLRTHRHKQGMRARVNKGLIASNPPRGYTPTRDPHTGAITAYTFTPEIHAVETITALFLAGHSYSEIRRRLNKQHPPPPGRASWSYNNIRKIVDNDTYAGFPSWGDYTAPSPSPLIPPLWDSATHAAIIHERHRRKRRPYHRIGAGPLTGVAYCARCQRPLTRYTTSAHWYLRCPTHAHRSATGRACHPNNLPEHRALTALTQHLATLATPAAIDLALAQLPAPAEHQRLTHEHQRLTHTIHNLTTQRTRLAHALAAGHMQPDIYAAADTDLLSQLHAAQQRAAELSTTIQHLPQPQTQRKALASLASAFPDLLAQAEPAEISTLLQTAGIRITCDSGAVVSITP